GLIVHVGDRLIALPDLGAAIGEIEVVALGVREEAERDPKEGIVVAEGEYGFGRSRHIFVGNEVGEGPAVGEIPAPIALAAGWSAARKIGEREIIVGFSKLQRIAGI